MPSSQQEPQFAAVMALSSSSWFCRLPIHHVSEHTTFLGLLLEWIAVACRSVEGVLKPLVAHLQQAGQLARADEAFYRMNVSKAAVPPNQVL